MEFRQIISMISSWKNSQYPLPASMFFLFLSSSQALSRSHIGLTQGLLGISQEMQKPGFLHFQPDAMFLLYCLPKIDKIRVLGFTNPPILFQRFKEFVYMHKCMQSYPFPLHIHPSLTASLYKYNQIAHL